MGSREWGVVEVASLFPLPTPDSPFPSSVILRHRASDAYCQNSFDRVSRLRHHPGERVAVFFREFREDEIRRVIYGMVGGDAQTQPRKILPSQFLNDRLQPFLAASAPS